MATDEETLRARIGAGREEAEAALDALEGPSQALAALGEELARLGLSWRWAELVPPSPEALSTFAALFHPADAEIAARWVAAADALGAEALERAREAAATHASREGLRERARRAAQGSPAIRRWLSSPVAMRARCEECGRDFVSEVGAVIFDPEAHAAHVDGQSADAGEGIYVPLVLACPFCAAADAYAVEEPSAREIATRALAAVREPGPWVVQVGAVALTDGTPIRRPSEGLAILRERADAEPDDGGLWRALGNFALRAGRGDEAIDAFRRGAEDPRELECALAVAVHEITGGEVLAPEIGSETDGALEALARALSRLPGSDRKRRPGRAAQLAELVRRLRDSDPAPLALIVDERVISLAKSTDWSRLGELLGAAATRAIRLERQG